MRKKKNLTARMEVCAPLWVTTPEALQGRWREQKPGASLLRLELGCGKGRFTAETAAAHPEDLYVAVERVPDAMVVAMERCLSMGLTNVFFIDGDADGLSNYFAPDEVDLIYINFCDPWPSKKHARRRLTHESFLRDYRKVMKDGGQLHFKTDNRDLFEWSLFQFPKAGFALSQVTRDLHANGICGVMTDYEEKFHSMGIPINRCVGTKEALPDVPVADTLQDLLPEWEIREIQPAEAAHVSALLERDAASVSLEGEIPTLDSILAGLTSLPPRCGPDQKHYLGLWRQGRLEAVIDLVEGYPRARTLWLGFFMVSPSLRGQGLGQAILSALPDAASRAGMDSIRLACLKTNAAGHRFWKFMGFQDLREGAALATNQPVWIMERLARG